MGKVKQERGDSGGRGAGERSGGQKQQSVNTGKNKNNRTRSEKSE